MVLTYKECVEQFNGLSKFKRALAEGKVHKLEKGYYSDQKYEPEMAVISRKYPNAILTLNSAFYYHGLTDTIPDYYYMATDKDSAKIKDCRIVQSFDNSGQLMLGAEISQVEGASVLMYNKERLLIEAVRNRNRLPFEYYKELINNYRDIIYELDIQAIQEYAEKLPKTALVTKTLEMEVL